MKKEKLFLIIALVMVVAMAVPAVSAATLTIGSKTFAAAGETGTIDVILDSAPNGIFGYMFNVTMDDPAVAEFTSIKGPAWAEPFKMVGLADWQVAQPDDSFIKVLAPNGIPKGATNALMASIDIKAKGPGTATVTVVTSGIDYEISDADGTKVVPTVVNGVIQVIPVCADADQDGVCDDADNCPAVANADQANADQDGAGDACEECDADPLKTAPGTCGCGVVDTPGCGVCSDVDTDGVCDDADNCPAVANADQANADQDEAGDACDRCPSDPAKTVPGQCGCGVAEGTCPGVPEFPSMVVPAVSLIGMLAVIFLAQRKEN